MDDKRSAHPKKLSSMPAYRTYHGSRATAALFFLMMLFVAWFVANMFESSRNENVPIIIAIVVATALLIIFRRYLIIMLNNPVWLEFGPDGIGGYLFKGTVPWSRVKHVFVTWFNGAEGPGSELSILDVYLRPEGEAIRAASSDKANETRVRIFLDDIKGAKPPQIHKELLHAFTCHSQSVPDRVIFPRYRGLTKMIPLLLVVAAICLGFVLLFVKSNFLRYSLIALLALDLVCLIALYWLRPDLVREKAPWLVIGPEGLGGPAFTSSIPWRDILDIYVVENERSIPYADYIPRETHLIVELSPASAYGIPESQKGEHPRQIKLDMDGLYDLHYAQLAVDCLRLFARYSDADATRYVPERLEKLFIKFERKPRYG